MKQPIEGHQGWRWVHHLFSIPLDAGHSPAAHAGRRTGRYWAGLIALGIGLNVGLTVFGAF